METNPYAAPGAVVDDASTFGGNDLEARKATRGQRLGAVLLDNLIFVVCLLPIAIPAYTSYVAKARGETVSTATMGAFSILCFVLFLGVVIYTCVLLYQNGQTIGKRLLRIKIVRTDGSRASLVRIIFLRALPIALLGVIPLIGRFIGLVDALMIFREDKRCLHDNIADTIVIVD